MELKPIPVVFTPSNEPYLGRALLFHFDQLISSALEQKRRDCANIPRRVHSDHQEMACQVIAQAHALALSIASCLGKLPFRAHVLLLFGGKGGILLYLHSIRTDIERGKAAGTR